MSQAAHVNRAMTPLEWTMLVALSAVWGGAFFFNAVAVKELPVLTVVVARVALAALVLLAAMKLAGVTMPTGRRVWAAFFAMGLLNNAIPFSLIVWGQSHIASGVASILNASTPLFTVVLAHVLTADEKMTGGRLVGVVAGSVGVAVMIGGDAVQSLGTNVVAQFACVAAAISYAFAGIFGRRFRAMGIAPMATATGQLVASSILLVPVMLVIDSPWSLPAPSAKAVGALIAIATLSTALGYVLYSDSRHRRRDQPPAGDVSDPGQCHSARGGGLKRDASGAAHRRDGNDRHWSRGNRRPAVASGEECAEWTADRYSTRAARVGGTDRGDGPATSLARSAASPRVPPSDRRPARGRGGVAPS